MGKNTEVKVCVCELSLSFDCIFSWVPWMSMYKFIPTLSVIMAREFACLSGGPKTFEESLTCIMPHTAFPAATSNDAKMMLGHLMEIQSL